MTRRIRQTIAIALCLVTVGCYFASTPIVVNAETTLEKLQKAKEEKNKTENVKKNAQQQKKELQIQKNSLLGQLSELNDDLQQVSDNLEKIEEDIVAQKESIEMTTQELNEAILTEQEQYRCMKIRIRFMYERGNTTLLDLLLSSSGFADFLNKSDYVEQLSKYDQKMLIKYQNARKHVEEVKQNLEQELVELDNLQQETQVEQQKVSAMVKETTKNVASYADQIDDAQDTIDQLDQMISSQEADIAALQKQYEQELALSRLAQASAWRDISEVHFEEGDRYLLANLIYCEAGGEPYAGQLAVGAVVINRVLSSRYPNTVLGVIYQRKQFSPVDNGRLALALANNKATQRCYQAADEAMSGMTNVGQCVYFRTPIPGLTGISIGGHIFY